MLIKSSSKSNCLIHETNQIRLKSGFTLVELLITLAIITILLTIATPPITNQLKQWEARKTRQNIVNSIRIAKAESVIHRTNVIMCPADSYLRCHKDATELLILFTDDDKNSLFNPDTDKLLLSLNLNLDYGKIHLRTSNRNHFKFFGDTGLPRGHFGHIKYCPNDKNTALMYQVSLNSQGITKFKPKKSHATKCPS